MTLLRSFFVTLLLVAMPLRSAHADDREEAKRLAGEGDRLADKGKYERALAKYLDAYDAYSSPKLFYPIAKTEQALGRHLDALDRFQQLLLDAPDMRADWREDVLSQIETLKEKIGMLTFEITPDGATVKVNDVDRGESPLGESVYVDPGKHNYTVSKRGYKTLTKSIKVSANEDRPIDVTLEKLAALPKSEFSLAAQRYRRRMFVGAIVLTTAVGLSSAVTGVLALSKHSTFEDTNQSMDKREAARRSGKKLALTADLMMVTTVAAAAFTTYWYMSKIKPMSQERRPVGSISPYASPEGAGVVVTGTF